MEKRDRRVTGRSKRVPEPQRFRDDRGAVMAEAALITPVFFLLLFGVLEFGGLFRDYLTMNNATAAGTRQAAIAGNDLTADYQILQAVKKASAAMPVSQIKRVVVYKAADATTPVPAGCKAGTPASGSCNTYTGADFSRPASDIDCLTAPALAQYWCPDTRKDAVLGPNSPPDWLGLYIEVEHPWVTGLFGAKVTISNTSVVKLEPSSLV